MDFDVTEETLEEGRNALYQLERQLKERNNTQTDGASEVSSKQPSTISGRRLMDQVPRNTRLNQRLESLGLTVEQLDDRGLLEGGASVPNYLLLNKSRRPLELQPRSHRLQERGKESTAKLLNALHHMLRIFARRGFNIEDYCIERDPKRTGYMKRKQLVSLIQELHIPFSSRENNEIVMHYLNHEHDACDYGALLQDARVPKKLSYNDLDIVEDANDEDGVNSLSNNNVLVDVRRMLLESVQRLQKHPDDVYRMFARWDTMGTGTVTATQFLRVLARLHVDLSDQDQDFLIELLDTNAMGRIDFEGLLAYCFASLNGSPREAGFGHGVASYDDNGGETVSAVSIDGNISVEQKSVNSGNVMHANTIINNIRRPQTATSVSRPYSNMSHNFHRQIGDNEMHAAVQSGPQRNLYTTGGDHLTRGSSEVFQSDHHNTLPAASSEQRLPHFKRPMTASARVALHGSPSPKAGSRGRILVHHDDRNFVPDRPDDVINDDDDPIVHDGNRMYCSADRFKATYGGRDSSNHESASFNDNTLTTDPEEHNYGSHREIPTISSANMMMRPTSQYQYGLNTGVAGGDNYNDGSHSLPQIDTQLPSKQYVSAPFNAKDGSNQRSYYTSAMPVEPIFAHDSKMDEAYAAHPDRVSGSDIGHSTQRNQHNLLNSSNVSSTTDGESKTHKTDPSDHLILLANQILTTVKEILLNRYRRGKSLTELFCHFDRDGKLFFDKKDFMRATSDLRIEISERVAGIAIGSIAIDGMTEVSFGEFKVFVLDPDHKQLEESVQQQLAHVLEQQGRSYSAWMVDAFWSEEDSVSEVKQSGKFSKSTMVSTSAFVRALTKIGLVLSSTETTRLVDRFDVCGQDMCSIDRFVRMVQTSKAWKYSERVLDYQDEAIEESKFLRNQLNGPRSTYQATLPNYSNDLITMCEYLCIRVLSDQNMVWIAEDALKAPLPLGWVAQRDNKGRTYFYNHLTNQSKWEHPLDPHFRKLRDKYRQSSNEAGTSFETHHSEGYPATSRPAYYLQNIESPPFSKTEFDHSDRFSSNRVEIKAATNNGARNVLSASSFKRGNAKPLDIRPHSALPSNPSNFYQLSENFDTKNGGNSDQRDILILQHHGNRKTAAKSPKRLDHDHSVTSSRPVSAPQPNLATDKSNLLKQSVTVATGKQGKLDQSKHVVELIYNAPYMKFQPVNPEAKFGSNKGSRRDVHSHSHERFSRPNSSNAFSTRRSNGLTSNSNRDKRLAEMFEGDIIKKLDSLMTLSNK